MPERQALGRGLSALLREPARTGAEARALPIADIHPNVLQPRRHFDEAAIEELAASIREKGVLQPIVVRRRESGYEILLGERRWRAARLAGLETVPALVREASDRESLEIALVENIQREDLNAIELASAYRSLIEMSGLTQEEVAVRLGKDRATVANTIRLLSLPDDIQRDVLEGTLSMGHARALLGVEPPSRQRALRDRIVRDGISVREAERLAREGRLAGPAARKRSAAADPGLARVQADLQRRFQTPVIVRRHGRRGTIQVVFYDDRDLDRLLKLMLG